MQEKHTVNDLPKRKQVQINQSVSCWTEYENPLTESKAQVDTLINRTYMKMKSTHLQTWDVNKYINLYEGLQQEVKGWYMSMCATEPVAGLEAYDINKKNLALFRSDNHLC